MREGGRSFYAFHSRMIGARVGFKGCDILGMEVP